MRIDQIRSFEQLQAYLQNFRSFGDDAGEYDFIGTYLLFEALLDNLARHHLYADLESLAETCQLNEKQSEFLKKLLNTFSEKKHNRKN